MSVPMKKTDPAYWLLEESLSGRRKIKKPTVYNENCYICIDPEFALMGLPLCYPCYKCGAHVPADDSICDNGHDQMEEMDDTELNCEEHLENSEDKSIVCAGRGSKILEDMMREIAEKIEEAETLKKLLE